MEWQEYLVAVARQAQELGYTTKQVLIFKQDIYDMFTVGKSVEECVEVVF